MHKNNTFQSYGPPVALRSIHSAHMHTCIHTWRVHLWKKKWAESCRTLQTQFLTWNLTNRSPGGGKGSKPGLVTGPWRTALSSSLGRQESVNRKGWDTKKAPSASWGRIVLTMRPFSSLALRGKWELEGWSVPLAFSCPPVWTRARADPHVELSTKSVLRFSKAGLGNEKLGCCFLLWAGVSP